MKDVSYIEVTQKQNALGKIEQYTYRWIGKSPYVRVSHSLLQHLAGSGNGASVQIGPYKLLKVGDEFHIDCVLYVRSDKLAALRIALYKSTRLLDLVYRRLIVTLAVWNLADFHPAYIPSWRDVKILKGLAKK
jgi:hypothetical protein